MRRLMRACALALVLALVGAACGEDRETTPIDQAEPGDLTDAGIEGAFGDAGNCDELVEQAVASYLRVVQGLGDTDRTEVDRIDAAMESFGGVGPDLQVRYDALDCGAEDFDAEVCAAAGDLETAGPVAEDFVNAIREGCDQA